MTIRQNKSMVLSFMLVVVLIITVLGPGGGTPQLKKVEAAPAGEEGAFPTKDFKFVLWTNPGGGYDAYARAMASVMKKYLPKGVDVIVVYKPGGGGIVGYTYIYHSRPDGYTFGFVSLPGALVTAMVQKVKYDFTKVEWLGTVVAEEQAVFVRADSEINSWTDAEAKLKAGGKLTELVLKGDTNDLKMMILRAESGLDWKSVTGYKTRKNCLMGIMRGDGDLAGAPSAGYAADFVKRGKIKPILILEQQPSKQFPNTEYLGGLGYSSMTWSRGLFAPAGVPESRKKVLVDVIRKTLHDEEFLAWAKKVDRPVGWASPAETAKRVDEANRILEKYRKQIEEYFATY